MNSSPDSAPPRAGSAVCAILVGGLVAGIGDLIFAVVYYGAPVKNILHHIAAGLIGKETSYAGGFATAAWGVLLHFVVSTGAAAVFVFASRKRTMMIRRPVPIGLTYGAVVYFVMNWVVVPLSAVAGPKYPPVSIGVRWLAT